MSSLSIESDFIQHLRLIMTVGRHSRLWCFFLYNENKPYLNPAPNKHPAVYLIWRVCHVAFYESLFLGLSSDSLIWRDKTIAKTRIDACELIFFTTNSGEGDWSGKLTAISHRYDYKHSQKFIIITDDKLEFYSVICGLI